MDFTPKKSKNLYKFDYNICYLYEDFVNDLLPLQALFLISMPMLSLFFDITMLLSIK